MISIEELLGVQKKTITQSKISKGIKFSFLFFSDVRKDVSNTEKFNFIRDLTVFADREGFEAIYLPERHFNEFGSIFSNSAVVASSLIPQTERIRFRTAGITLPLHHPAQVVESWATNDVLSGGRVDLGFGSGWNKTDFILSPETYSDRRKICGERIALVQKLWRGESVSFLGVDGEETPITVYPRPIQKELNVWLLASMNADAFHYAGTMGYNVYTMLSGDSLEVMRAKVKLYRKGREDAGYDPNEGIVTLMMHTQINKDMKRVESAIEKPFKEYLSSFLGAHYNSEGRENERQKILDYSYKKYCKSGAIFGSVQEGREMVDKIIEIGVDEISFLMDFGVDYSFVKESLPYLNKLVSYYL